MLLKNLEGKKHYSMRLNLNEPLSWSISNRKVYHWQYFITLAWQRLLLKMPSHVLNGLQQSHEQIDFISTRLFSKSSSPRRWIWRSCRWRFRRWSRRWEWCWRTGPAWACTGWSFCRRRQDPASGSASPCCRTLNKKHSDENFKTKHASLFFGSNS